MRAAFLTIVLLTASTAASAFEHAPVDEKTPLVFNALEQRAAPPLRAGRTIATIDLGKQAVTFAAYGRRARARALGNSAEILHARAMGKVFEGGPQPALVTFEVSLKF